MEFAVFGGTVPATTYNITLMRALMAPVADDALALALDRIRVFTTNTDDVLVATTPQRPKPSCGRRAARARRLVAEHPIHPAHVQRGRSLLRSDVPRSCVAFLHDINDVLCFYKEAVPGEDFLASRIYRRSVSENIPYLAACRRSLDSGLAA
ncbi:hypothetical protein [Streptomyces sp. NPDC050982]|uniref:hypothetical protein n=1 Tax=Streptomyces sp. NPDC050982 TaxID=3154746 RepID=UPI0033CEE8A5